jgi:hypothetical protein
MIKNFEFKILNLAYPAYRQAGGRQVLNEWYNDKMREKYFSDLIFGIIFVIMVL